MSGAPNKTTGSERRSPQSHNEGKEREIKLVSALTLPLGSAHDLAELKLPNALPDRRLDEKAWTSLQALLTPPPPLVEPEIEENCLRLTCSITSCLMCDPVVTADGQPYEREAIAKWLVDHDTSPLTGATLKNKDLTPALLVRKAIARYVTGHPELKTSELWYLPKTWVQELTTACTIGDAKAIQVLVTKESRLLLHRAQEGEHAGQGILHAVIAHHESLNLVIQLLEQQMLGLALASLLQGDSKGVLPLEYALGSGQAPNLIVSLMARMGLALSEFQLQNPASASHAPLNEALGLAVRGNNEIIVTWLLNAKANIEADQTPQGDSALQQAVRLSTLPLVRLLCQRGASSRPRLDGQTPLHAAMQQPSLEIVKILCDEKQSAAILNHQDIHGRTALHYAAASGNAEKLMLLLKQRVLLNQVDEQKETALHIATRQLQIVKNQTSKAALECLLEAGADQHLENKAGQTPRELAKSLGSDTETIFEEIITLLFFRNNKQLRGMGQAGLELLALQQILAQQTTQLQSLRKLKLTQEETIHTSPQTLALLIKTQEKEDAHWAEEKRKQNSVLAALTNTNTLLQKEVTQLKTILRPVLEEDERQERMRAQDAEELRQKEIKDRAEALRLQQAAADSKKEEDAKKERMRVAAADVKRNAEAAADSKKVAEAVDSKKKTKKPSFFSSFSFSSGFKRDKHKLPSPLTIPAERERLSKSQGNYKP